MPRSAGAAPSISPPLPRAVDTTRAAGPVATRLVVSEGRPRRPGNHFFGGISTRSTTWITPLVAGTSAF